MEKSSSNFQRTKIPKGCDLAGRGDVAAHRLGDPADEIQPRLMSPMKAIKLIQAWS